MKIIQTLPVIAYGDAVGNDTRAIRDILAGEGYETAIYAASVSDRLPAGTARPIEDMPPLDGDDVMIYHASTGAKMNYDLPNYGGRKMMIYHNITPPAFFRPYNSMMEQVMQEGLQGMRFLKDQFEYVVADSDYNRQQLREMGYTCPIDVCPILIPYEDYDAKPSRKVLEQYEGDGWTNLLFVGRVSPNKKQEDVIRAFCAYSRKYNPKSRLFLVGNAGQFENYEDRLKRYAEALGVGDRVIFPGHIKFDAILAYYRLADVFVCMSEHEGFCVPLVEAMYFGKPIVAYGCCAVPETLGKGGILLDSKDPELAADAIQRALTDEETRAAIRKGQEEQLAAFSYETVKGQILACVRKMIQGSGETKETREAPVQQKSLAPIGKKIGFVTPWYGEKIGGGAEAELRGVAHHLRAAGVDLEVLTTCVKSFADDWNLDLHEPGLTEEAGIPVRRFRVRKGDNRAFCKVNEKLMAGIVPTEAEEEVFNREMVNSPDLVRYLKDHGDEYGLFFFIPYMFGPVYHGCQVHPEKSVLIPCLHDEAYAYMQSFRKAFSRVKGMVFNAEPERLLAERLYGVKGENFVTFGIGMDTGWTADGERFRQKYGIRDPFILYAGRKDAGKRVDVLVRHFMRYKQRVKSPLKLVLIGGGKIDIPDRRNIIDLGFVDLQDKYDAYAAAELFCNPSEMESFSIVIMESWLAGRPVLVNGQCAVTRDFVHQANGGLYYESYAEFEECVKYLTGHPETAEQMARNGGEYVRSHFAWDVITRRYLDYIRRLCGDAEEK